MNQWIPRVSVPVILAVMVCGCIKNGGAAPSSAPPTTISLDGFIDKWRNKKPAWDNGPVPSNMWPQDVHIMKVYFDNDSNYLYCFIQCSPTIPERYKTEQLSGTELSGMIGQIYFDPDDNPNTGSPSDEGDTHPNRRGYKIMAMVEIGISISASGQTSTGPYVSYDLFSFSGPPLDVNNGFNAQIAGSRQSSTNPRDLIAYGKDGVEMAFPLSSMGLKAGSTERIMIAPMSMTEKSRGFVAYQCR